MALRVLVTDGMDAGAMEQLRKDGYEVIEQFYEPDQLGAALRDFDVVIIRSATKIKEPQIDAAAGSRLKLIIRAGVGVDNIAVKYAEEHGIQVKNTPRASSNAVAELALALLFSCARNISIAGHTMRENKWEKKAYSKGFELSGKTMGVIGYGRIGQLVGAKGQALGMCCPWSTATSRRAASARPCTLSLWTSCSPSPTSSSSVPLVATSPWWMRSPLRR